MRKFFLIITLVMAVFLLGVVSGVYVGFGYNSKLVVKPSVSEAIKPETIAEDKTPPTLTLNKIGGNLNPSEMLVATSFDDISGIAHIGYAWDEMPTVTVHAATASISAPSTVGEHTLRIYAVDKNGNYMKWSFYKFNITSNPRDIQFPKGHMMLI